MALRYTLYMPHESQQPYKIKTISIKHFYPNSEDIEIIFLSKNSTKVILGNKYGKTYKSTINVHKKHRSMTAGKFMVVNMLNNKF